MKKTTLKESLKNAWDKNKAEKKDKTARQKKKSPAKKSKTQQLTLFTIAAAAAMTTAGFPTPSAVYAQEVQEAEVQFTETAGAEADMQDIQEIQPDAEVQPDSGTVISANTGSVFITNPTRNTTYKAYKMMDMVYTDDASQFRFDAGSQWAGFFLGEEIQNIFLFVNEDPGSPGVYTAHYMPDKTDAQSIQEFAGKALSYAIAQNLTPVVEVYRSAHASGDLELAGLDSGYYLITGTADANSETSLTGVITVNSAQDAKYISSKNTVTTVEKMVLEDGSSQWQDCDDKNIGDVVSYSIDITVGSDLIELINSDRLDRDDIALLLSDTMDPGLTWNGEADVYFKGDKLVRNSQYTLYTGDDLVLVPNNPDASCDFQIGFTYGQLFELQSAGMKEGDVFTVTCQAKLNTDAGIGSAAPNQNTMSSYLNNHYSWTRTDEDKVNTYTWSLNVMKYTLEGDTEKSLAGAKFKLYRLDDAGTASPAALMAKMDGDSVLPGFYRLDPENGQEMELVVDAQGALVIEGLDSGSYRLVETEAPDGYVLRTDPIDFEITRTSFAADGTVVDTTGIPVLMTQDSYNADNPLKVKNDAGISFPETGAINNSGMYAIAGFALVVAAGLILSIEKTPENKKNKAGK